MNHETINFQKVDVLFIRANLQVLSLYKTVLLAITVTVIALAGFQNHEAHASTLLFSDNYTNAGWTQVGSSVTVNSMFFPGSVHFNNAAGGGDDRVLKKLPSALPLGGWTANFDYKFTASNIPGAYPFVLTTSSANPEQQGTGNSVIVLHGIDTNGLNIRTFVNSVITDSASIPISVNAQYYVSLVRTPTQLVLNVFSDPARTIQISGSPVSLNIASTDFGNLNFIQHSTKFTAGSGRTLTACIDNTRIFTP